MNGAEVLAVLEAGEFAGLIGVVETQTVEFKRDPYRLDEPRQRFELAKDAAGVANGPEGVIIVGVETERPDAASPLDTVSGLRPFPRDSIDADQYLKVIDQRVFPRIKGLRVDFFTAEADKVLVAIVIPPQAEEDKFFLVNDVFSEDARAPGWIVAVPIRSIDRVVAINIGELHAYISRGRTFGASLDALVAEVTRLAGNDAVGEPPLDRVRARLRARLAELEGPPPQIQ